MRFAARDNAENAALVLKIGVDTTDTKTIQGLGSKTGVHVKDTVHEEDDYTFLAAIRRFFVRRISFQNSKFQAVFAR